MFAIANGHICLTKIDWDTTFCEYLIISRDASLEPTQVYSIVRRSIAAYSSIVVTVSC